MNERQCDCWLHDYLSLNRWFRSGNKSSNLPSVHKNWSCGIECCRGCRTFATRLENASRDEKLRQWISSNVFSANTVYMKNFSLVEPRGLDTFDIHGPRRFHVLEIASWRIQEMGKEKLGKEDFSTFRWEMKKKKKIGKKGEVMGDWSLII